MPLFPRYESKGQLTTQTPSVGAVQSTEGEIQQNQAKMAGSIATASTEWAKYIDTSRKNIALANAKTEIATTEANAALEQDPNKMKQYLDELNNSKDRNSKGLSGSASAELALEYKLSAIKLGGEFKKKQIQINNVATQQRVDGLVSLTPEEGIVGVEKILKDNPEMGFIDASGNFQLTKEGYSIKEKANKELGENRVANDINKAKTVEDIQNISQNITNGYYEKGGVSIDPEKKKALLEVADRASNNLEKKIEAQQIENIAKNRVKMIQGVASGQIDPQTMDITAIAEYDPTLAAVLMKSKDFLTNYDPKVPKEDQRVSMAGVLAPSQILSARNYAKSISSVFDQTNNEKLGEFMLRELDKHGDGTNSSIKLAAFMQLASLKYKANNPSGQQDLEATNKLASIQSAVVFLKSANPYLSPQMIGDFIIKNYLSGNSGKQQVMEEAKSVLEKAIIERYSKAAKLPGIPNKIVDGEQLAETLHQGSNELEESYNGNYSDQNRSE